MIVVVNERRVEVDHQITVAELLGLMGFPERGIAVAVDSSLLPRSDWATKLSELSDGARIEVVTAVQGG